MDRLLSISVFGYCQAQPQTPTYFQLGAKISIIIILSSHHNPTPTRESIIQTQIYIKEQL